MTEAEWLNCDDPDVMLAHLGSEVSNRKRRLLAIFFCRQVKASTEVGEFDTALATAEEYADGWAARSAMVAMGQEAKRGPASLAARPEHFSLAQAVFATCRPGTALDVPHVLSCLRSEAEVQGIDSSVVERYQTTVLRDIFGNPFRSLALDSAWLTSTVISLAEAIYDDHAFDRLPILADALQDAGCEDADILGHFRGDGPHVRGCWVVDLVLGKS